MRAQLLSIAALVATTLFGQASATHNVDPSSSKVLWTATKLTGDHTGDVPVSVGSITVKDGGLMAAEMTIDMTGITNLDIEREEGKAKLVAHLKSPDFFDVAQFPTATFKATHIEAIADATPGKPNYRVTGDLTIKGITLPNTFDCIFWTVEGTARAAGNLTFDRAKYDVRFRSKSFFPDLGDKVISDTVSLTIDIAAK